MILCGNCGAENASGNKFCPQCGFSLSGETSELRQLSVLFSDIVGSTRLAAQLDPEDFHEIQEKYHTLCSSIVAEMKGFTAELLGDGVVAYFGYPTAHEDDPARAVDAGLRIAEAAGKLFGAGQPLAVRVGIDTGITRVGLTRFTDRKTLLASGAVLSKASRIQAEAQPGTVVVSQSTCSLIKQHFHFDALPPVTLRGFAAGERLYRVLGRVVEDWDLVPAVDSLTPLAGRSDEMKTLRQCWLQALEGRFQIVSLRGEPGVGKSRLVQELKQEARSSGPLISEFRCSDYHRNTAFYPVAENLNRRLGLTLDQPDEAKRAALELWLNEQGQNNRINLWSLASLLKLDVAPPDDMTPQHQRRLVLERVSDLLFRPSGSRPHLIVMEDLHWADPSTLELLETTLAAGATGSMMMVFTYRPEFQPSWSRSPEDITIDLKPVDRATAMQMIRAVASGSNLPERVVSEISAKAEGVPLFIEEVTRAFVESASASQFENAREPNDLNRIPLTVRGVLMARIDRLGESREVLRMAAVLGREFSFRTLQQLSRFDEVALTSVLQSAEDASIVYRKADGLNQQYFFKHALIQEAAYGSLVRPTRQLYHRRAAEVIRAQADSDIVQSEILAVHYDGAGQFEDAMRCWLVAGKEALKRAANREASAHLQSALRALERLPENAQLKSLELEIQLSLMAANMALYGWAAKQVECCCIRARDLSLELNDQQTYFGALWGIWTVHFLRAELEEALVIGHQLLEMALPSGLPMLETMSRHSLGFTEYCMGRFDRAFEQGVHAERIYDRSVEQTIVAAFQFSSSVAILSFQSHSAWLMGDEESAERTFQAASTLVRDLGHPACEAFFLGLHLYVHHSKGNVEAIRSSVRRLRDLSEQEGYEAWKPMAELYLGWLSVRDQDIEGVERCIRAVKAATGTRNLFTHDKLIEAEALELCGRHDEALTSIEEGIAWWRATKLALMVPELFRLRGTILEALGDFDAATEAFDEAIASASEFGSVPLLLRAGQSKVKLLRSIGRVSEARDLQEELRLALNTRSGRATLAITPFTALRPAGRAASV